MYFATLKTPPKAAVKVLLNSLSLHLKVQYKALTHRTQFSLTHFYLNNNTPHLKHMYTSLYLSISLHITTKGGFSDS